MKRILGYFLQGVLLVAPVVIVIYILYSLFITIDGWLIEKIERWIRFFGSRLGNYISVYFSYSAWIYGTNSSSADLLKP